MQRHRWIYDEYEARVMYLFADGALHVLVVALQAVGEEVLVVRAADVAGERGGVHELVAAVVAGPRAVGVRLLVPAQLGARVQHQPALAHEVAHLAALVQVVPVPATTGR